MGLKRHAKPSAVKPGNLKPLRKKGGKIYGHMAGSNTIEKRILFVDDEVTVRNLMQKFFIRLGYQVQSAESARAAMELLEKTDYPLIIIDLKMPEMTGTELCQHIRKTNRSSIIYAFSGFIWEFEPEALERFGFDGYLMKPSKMDVLKKAVEGAFEKLEKRS